MRCDLACDIATSRAGIRNPGQLEADQTVSFENVQNVPEGSDHGAIAYTLHFLEAGNQGRRCAKCSPVAAPKLSVHSKCEGASLFVAALRKAQSFDHAFELVDILQ